MQVDAAVSEIQPFKQHVGQLGTLENNARIHRFQKCFKVVFQTCAQTTLLLEVFDPRNLTAQVYI